MKNFLTFFYHFLKDPKGVGAVVPLSKTTSQEMIKHYLKRDKQQPCRILEVGAGIGNISHQIVLSLEPKDRFDIVEINHAYCEVLTKSFKSNPQVSVHNLSILNWSPPYTYHYIISTLPLNSFDVDIVEDVFEHYEALIEVGGVLTYVEYAGLQTLTKIFSNKKNREKMDKRRKFLKNIQDEFMIEKTLILRNFLPCHIYHLILKPHHDCELKLNSHL